MAFDDIAKRIKYPEKTSERFKRLDAYERLLDGTLYDHIKNPFDKENDGSDYVPLRERRPSVIWNGAALITRQLAGLLWGDEQTPMVRTYFGEEPNDADRKAELSLQHLIEVLELDSTMLEITRMASVGSCAVVVRAMDDKSVYIEILEGKRCTPIYDQRNPNKFLALDVLYPILGSELAEYGYEIKPDDLIKQFWFRLKLEEDKETWFKPLIDEKYQKLGEIEGGVKIVWEVDQEYPNNFGEINVIWVRAPGQGKSRFDGACLFGDAVDISVDIDYSLSQTGRGLRYSADPMLAIRRGELRQGSRPAGYGDDEDKTQKDASGSIVKSANNILDIEPGGEASLLEITGKGLEAFREFIRYLRELWLEVVGGMKSDAENEKGVESGRALEMLFQALVLLVKRWRPAVGNRAFIPLIRLLLIGLQNNILEIEGVDPVDPDTTLRLVWPTWMTPTGADLLATANAWQSLAGGSPAVPVPVLPRDFVTRLAAVNLGATDTATIVDELDKQVDADKAEQVEDESRAADTQIKVAAAKPKPTVGAKK